MTELTRSRFLDPLNEQRALWAPLYESVLGIVGSTALIIPLGDTNHENSGRTTVTTIGEEQAIFTYSEAISAFDTPPATLGPSRIPLIAFNSTDEEADSPDAAFWTRDDAGGANGLSIGFWGNVTDTASIRVVLSKFDVNVGSELREWQLEITSADEFRITLADESANVFTLRTSDAAITMGTMTFFVMTYDGAGGASAGDTIILYENGAVIASTASNNAGYVGMEDLATNVGLGGQHNASGTFQATYNGTMLGGPLGPLWVPGVLTADQVLRLYQLGRAAADL